MADISPFFKGSVQEAIQLARSKALLLLVVVEDMGEESARLGASCWTHAALCAELQKSCISLQLRNGSAEAANFKALFPVAQLPSLSLISCYGGTLHSSAGFVAPEDLLATVQRVAAAFQQQVAAASLLAARLMAAGGPQGAAAATATATPPHAPLSASASSQPSPATERHQGSQAAPVATLAGDVTSSLPLDPPPHELQQLQPPQRQQAAAARDGSPSAVHVDASPATGGVAAAREAHDELSLDAAAAAACTATACPRPPPTPAAAAPTAAMTPLGASMPEAPGAPPSGSSTRSAGQGQGGGSATVPVPDADAATPVAASAKNAPQETSAGASTQVAAASIPSPAAPSIPPSTTASTAADAASTLRSRKPAPASAGAAVPAADAKADPAAATGPGAGGEKRRAEEVTDVHIRFRIFDGTSLTKDFPVARPASDMLAFLRSENVAGGAACQLAIQYPRKVLSEQDLRRSFAELGLVPSAAVVVERAHAPPSALSSLASRAGGPARGVVRGALGGGLSSLVAAFGKLWAYLMSALSLSRFLGRPGGPGATGGAGVGASRGPGGRMPPQGGAATGGPSSSASAGQAAAAGSWPLSARPGAGANVTGASSASLATAREQRLRRFNQQPGSNVHSLSSASERKPPNDPSNNSYWNGNSVEFGGDDDSDGQ